MKVREQQNSIKCFCSGAVLSRMLATGCALLLAFLFLSSSAWSQGNQGTIEGSIVDQSGAAVSTARLTAINDSTHLRFEAAADPSGLFTFPVLPVGTYTIEIQSAGFSKLTQKGVTLTVGAH